MRHGKPHSNAAVGFQAPTKLAVKGKVDMKYVQKFSDVDITYGGWFFCDNGDSCDVIRVTTNETSPVTVDVEVGTIYINKLSIVRSALQCYDMSVHRQLDKEDRRYNIWFALASYCGFDIDSYFTIQVEEGEAIRGVKYFVHGRNGLQDWLNERYDIEWS